MAEATEHINDTAELEKQVDSLLGKARTPKERAADGTGAEPSLPTPGAGSPQDATTSGAGTDDLGQQVDALLDGAEGAAAPPGADASAALPTITSLDAELAQLADTLISGGFEDQDAVLPSAPAGHEPAGAHEPPTFKPSPAPAFSPPPTSPSSTPAKHPAPPAPATAAAIVHPPASKAKPGGAGGASGPTPAGSALLAARASGRSAWAATEPVLLRALDAISSPVRGRPKAVRDLFGWVAAVMAFNALSVWVFVLFVRSPEPPRPAPSRHEVAKAAHDAPPSHSPDEGHNAKPKAKASGHGAVRGPKPAKKKASPQHSGGH